MDANILEEVNDCILRIAAFEKLQGRRIYKSFKRGRKGRAGIEELLQFNIDIPDDFRALYWNYNGIKPPMT
ncbi:hypothetical protein KA005_24300, partial [bacterium]|nr:hypothetical protein [bacterium]